MVSWQVFVSIAFDMAEAKGAQFEGIEQGGAFMSDLADVWQADKDRYKQMTRQQVRSELQELVEA